MMSQPGKQNKQLIKIAQLTYCPMSQEIKEIRYWNLVN